MTTEAERGALFALLDDCDATAERRSSRLYTDFAHERVCVDGHALDAVCAAIEGDLQRGLHAVVVADYEFGRNLQFGTIGRGDEHALRVLMFRSCAFLSRDEASAWLASHEVEDIAGIAGIEASVTRGEFDQAIAAVQEALREGESYQINYTYRLNFDVFGAPLALYRRLRERQAVHYGAFIALPDGRSVVSCSPELFVEKAGDLLRARPMKGTAPRESDPEALHNDPKNRAENVMIVDLLRNDMSRVAVTGSVNVPALFSVEPYASVWQMTSTIEARVIPGTSFADIVRALFPCGSITGAPKYRTMQLIDEIESTPRGLYTGAIGWLDASGDFCLSVAIRTLVVDASKRRGVLGIGAGIVLDSVAADEYEECLLKARFLTGADPGFELFETCFATRDAGVRHYARHVARLKASAAYLGFAFDETALGTQVAQQCAGFDSDEPHRLRIALDKSGHIAITSARLAPLPSSSVDVLLASERGFAPQSSSDPLLRHKTTRRADYDRAWKAAEAEGAFDMLFVNERGELTEGGRSSVFVQLDGTWFTPPIDVGVLPGVMRAVLIEEFGAVERALTLDELLKAQDVLISNALRGAVKARLRR
ncbi:MULTISPECIES: aminodeoxychorismate synthase component I [Caballeronia]|uniref:aminodeoxychorismate synthase component I n=1 Tax=Caballeronia TaxID=1827195 RepID=UPI0002388F69|nr:MULTISPECIES: aminodeoxychorismate synthase component I [unclassified Caballeronia]AET88225.1 para-aminobenzoate synthase, subunit I [Burkholderia sp. YI23]BAO85437.1 para-aminobenzoate synthase, subunit I [Burkholderia sp. RPE67]BBP95267.1 chloride transporter [Burkholderia sp. SFA1]MCE4542834.1 aminodeoxychorismate synthase component I [Caballeronia sp. PC1]MCE4568110.1 aminodeoxychorismate synthase component I [Caballeronia sp. CLC5]